MGKYEAWDVYIPPPRVNGSSLTPRTPYGTRAAACDQTAVVEVALTGDVVLQPPDAGGNAATNDLTDALLLRVQADGDDIIVLFGAKAATLTPSFAATGASASVGEVIIKGTYCDYMISPKVDKSMYIRARTTGAIVHYRISSPLGDAR